MTEPLPLTNDEKAIVKEYLQTCKDFHEAKYDGDPFDSIEITSYLCYCHSIKRKMKELYVKVPQIMKDKKLVPLPEYPYWL